MEPNLWRICRNSLNPVLVDVSDHVSFVITFDALKLGFSAVYASNCNIVGCSLWRDLSLVHKNHLDIP